jgi:hypothetical protein
MAEGDPAAVLHVEVEGEVPAQQCLAADRGDAQVSHLKAEAVNLYDRIDGEDLIDSPEDFDGTSGAPIDASVWGRLTDDDPTGTPSWGPPMRIDSVEIDARAVGQLQCRLTSADPTYNIQVPELRLAAEEVQ